MTTHAAKQGSWWAKLATITMLHLASACAPMDDSGEETSSVWAADGGALEDKQLPFATYQAESRTSQSGCVQSSNHAGYTGAGFMDFGGNGTWIEWNNIAAQAAGVYELSFRYANASSTARAAAILVNGVNIGSRSFAGTGAWSQWRSESIRVSLRAGSNRVRVLANTSAGGPNVDRMDVVGVDLCPDDATKVEPGECGCGVAEGTCGANARYEAEARTSHSGCSVASNHSGFTGSGFVDFGGNGTWIEWNTISVPQAGEYDLSFRYANASSSSRRGTILVNGQRVGEAVFAGTGAWTSWRSETIKAPLRAGNNTIRVLASSDVGGPNLDHMVVTLRPPSNEARGLYTWNFGGVEALEPSAGVSLLSSNGYTGIVVDARDALQLQKYLAASKQTADFRVVAAYVALQLNRGDAFSSARHKAAIDLLAQAGEGDLWFTFRDDDGTQTKQAIKALVSDIVRYAASKNVRTVLYPHDKNVYPTTAAAMELVNEINDANLGVAVNLTHELRAGHSSEAELRAAFEVAGDKLFAVTLAGAASDLMAVKALHESSYDLRPFIGLIKESGFTGPVGFLTHTLTRPNTYLPLSLDYWQTQCEAIGLYDLAPSTP